MNSYGSDLRLRAWESRRDSPIGRLLARTASVDALQGAKRALRRLVRSATAVNITRHDAAALRSALEIGAFETAERIVGELVDDVGPSAAVVIEALLVVGRRGEARRVAAEYRSQLERTDRGVAMLELLELGPARVRLPSGRVNCLRLDRAITRGELDIFGVTQQLQWLGWRACGIVDLDLLLFNAARGSEQSIALRFLRRYFAAYRIRTDDLRWTEPVVAGGLPTVDFGSLEKRRDGPLVSVLVPARNAERTVISAVDSLLAQTYEPLEVLVADDASQDGTRDALRLRYGAEPRVRLFISPVSQGPYNLKNALSGHARGELLTFHDADDLALPNRVADQVVELRGARIGCVGYGLRLRPNGTFAFFKDQRATRISPVSLLVRRDVFDSVGRFRPARIGADGELHAKLAQIYGPTAVSRLRMPLTMSSWGSGSLTRTPGSESLEDGFRSVSRRAYSELVARRFTLGEVCPDDVIEARLRETGNWAEAHPLQEMT